eukprot:TRINITY_DN79290_c0_g1_i1.p1 TRINITY_DN79290_c0_g1~~TRINITY_DN79290_c0_g1_i1.p1  ORF type:complete len:353 (+),score=51.51 TRINITY_DN79290_c0_g1_i1:32-1060(+)
MQNAAAEQDAIKATVLGIHARMQELDNLANGGPSLDDTPDDAVEVEDLTPEQWRQRLAALSAPVTAPAAPATPPPRAPHKSTAHLLESAGGASDSSTDVQQSSSSCRATEILNKSRTPIGHDGSRDFSHTGTRLALVAPNQVPGRDGALRQMPCNGAHRTPIAHDSSRDLSLTGTRAALIAPNQLPGRDGALRQTPCDGAQKSPLRSPGKMFLPTASAFANSGSARVAETESPWRPSPNICANPMPGRPSSLPFGSSADTAGHQWVSERPLHSALIRYTVAETAKAEAANKHTVCITCFDIPCRCGPAASSDAKQVELCTKCFDIPCRCSQTAKSKYTSTFR